MSPTAPATTTERLEGIFTHLKNHLADLHARRLNAPCTPVLISLDQAYTLIGLFQSMGLECGDPTTSAKPLNGYPLHSGSN
jgi:hypothetical protein